jgi:hypothetical protein
MACRVARGDNPGLRQQCQLASTPWFRGSFLPPNSNAGGSRAKARQRPSSKTSLNRAQLLTRKLNNPP